MPYIPQLVALTINKHIRFTYTAHGVLPDAGDEAPCDRCGGIMRQTQRRHRGGALRPTMRCTNNQCRTHRSIRRQNRFFYYADAAGRPGSHLSVFQILELVMILVAPGCSV